MLLFSLHSDLQVKVTPGTLTEGSWVTLTCSTACTLTEIPNPTYIWYMNGEFLFSDSSPQYQYSVNRGGSDSYSCALRGHDKLSSPEVTVGECCDLPPDLIFSVNSYWWFISSYTPLLYNMLVLKTTENHKNKLISSPSSSSSSCASSFVPDTSSLSCLRVTYTSRSICSLITSVDLPCTTIYPTG